METTQLLETPQAPKEKKGRKLPPFRMPRSKKGKKWLRRGIAAAVVLASVVDFLPVRTGERRARHGAVHLGHSTAPGPDGGRLGHGDRHSH